MNKLTARDAFGYGQSDSRLSQLRNLSNLSSIFPLPLFNCACRVMLLLETVRQEPVSGGYVCAQLTRASFDAVGGGSCPPLLFLNVCVDSVMSLLPERELQQKQSHPVIVDQRFAGLDFASGSID